MYAEMYAWLFTPRLTGYDKMFTNPGIAGRKRTKGA